MAERFRGKAVRIWSVLALLTCLAASGCSAFADTAPADPEPSRRPPLDTMEASTVGDRLTVTASVTGVSSQRSFTVHDVDLPDRGLLVLAEADARVGVPDLVTVTGTVALFTFTGFQSRYGLGDVRVYQRFESRKVLLADEVRSWATAGGTPANPDG
jgi:hypothetical protein